MEVLVINKTSDPIDEKTVHQCLEFYSQTFQSLLSRQEPRWQRLKKFNPDLELVVVFVQDSEIQQLNAQFRSKDYVTDILSFSPIEETSLGELVVCLNKIKTQAQEHGLTAHQELSYMLLHGLLHLLGYEHENNSSEAEIMFRVQEEIFELYLKSLPKV